VQYWHIVLVAFINGLISCVEMPTRQSIVSRVVPVEDLAAAVPVNAMTFNVARILGPAIGGIVLTKVGVSACYALNGVSFAALVWTGFAIKSNLKSLHSERGPLKDIVFEGALYTFRDHRLRALFILEAVTACVGLAYIPLVPAYVQEVLKDPHPKTGLGYAFSAIGVGAMFGLLAITQFSASRYRGFIIRAAMGSMGVGLIGLAMVRQQWFVYPVFAILGASAMMQLNTTNALFQLLAPDRLRGRVLAMHIWAINGLSPFGVLFFGWLAKTTKHISSPPIWLPATGVPLALELGGVCMLGGTLAALLSKRGLAHLVPLHEE
jgi:MFS family permease